MSTPRPPPPRAALATAVATALLIGFTSLAAAIQPVAPRAGLTGPASAPDTLAAPLGASAPPARTGPRLLSPTETRNSATPPGDLRPERPVTPQIRIPLGKAPPPAVPAPERAPAPGPVQRPVDATEAARNANAMAAARCESLVGEQVRAKCRDRVAREAHVR